MNALSELAEVDEPARRAQRIGVIAGLFREQARLTAQLQAELAVLHTEDTVLPLRRFVADELALAVQLSPWTMRRLVEEALFAVQYPMITARMVDGTWTAQHADAVLDELCSAGLSTTDCTRVVDLVLATGGHLSPHQLRQAIRAAILTLDLEAATEREAQQHTDRDVRAHAAPNGSPYLIAQSTAATIAAMMASIDALTWPRQPGDTRTASQRRFDALYDLVCGRILPGQWQAQVLVPLATLEGADQPAEIPGFSTITPTAARELIEHAGMRRLVVDDHGQLLTVDQHTHQPDQPVDPHAATGAGGTCAPAGERPARLRSNEAEPAPVDDPDPTLDPDLEPPDDTWHPSLRDLQAGRGADEPADSDPTAEDSPTGDDRPPSQADLDWAETTTSRAEIYADPIFTPPPTNPADLLDHGDASAVSEPVRVSFWSTETFTQALRALRTDPYQPVDLSTASYAVPKRLKRFLALRDKTCTFPGCGRPAHHCDNDHLIPWPRGSTTAPNLARECEHHHLAKHARFHVERLPDGTLRWTTPSGTHHDRPQRPLIPGLTPPGN